MLFRTTNTIALFACVAHAFRLSSNHYGPSSMTSTGTKMSSFESEIGAQAPLGFWDPLEILQDADQERFYRLRTVELKHGRISMLAFLGHVITAAGMRWPGEVAFGTKFADMKTGLAAFDTIPSAGIFQIVVFIGAMELGFKACKKDLESYCGSHDCLQSIVYNILVQYMFSKSCFLLILRYVLRYIPCIERYYEQYATWKDRPL